MEVVIINATVICLFVHGMAEVGTLLHAALLSFICHCFVLLLLLLS